MIHLALIYNEANHNPGAGPTISVGTKADAAARATLYGLWLAKCFEVPHEPLSTLCELRRSATGKPSFFHKETGEHFFFSSSHSENALLFGVSRNRDFAVDIEMVKPRAKMEAILRRFFTPEESALVRNSSDPIRTFLFLWTRREALVKTTGEGLAGITREAPVLSNIARYDDSEFFLSSILSAADESPELVAALACRKFGDESAPAFTLVRFRDEDEARRALSL